MILLFLLSFCALIFCSEPKNYCTDYIDVQSGDSCWQIATSHGITVNQLRSYNPDLDCDKLWVGQKVCIKTSTSAPSCTKTYTVVSGDYCYKIWTDNGLTESQLKELNEQLDCDKLWVGQVLCVSTDPKYSTKKVSTTTTVTTTTATTTVPSKPNDDYPPLPLVENDQTCFEFTTIQSNDSCKSLAFAYNLNLTNLQKQYDCSKLKVGDTLCVSHDFTCQLRHSIGKFDTCDSVGRVYKLNSTEIEELNEDVKCSEALKEGRRICVWSSHERALADVSCIKTVNTDRAASCYELSRTASLPIDFFRFLNPYLNCSNTIDPKTSICTASKSTPLCAAIRPVPSNTSCSDLAVYYSMSFPSLMSLNPTLHCDKLPYTEQICIGKGYFESAKCTDTLKAAPGMDTCDVVMRETGIIREQIEELNPGLNCSESLEWGVLVCISSLGMETHAAQNLVISELCNLVPELNATFQRYQENPNEENTFAMNNLMLTSLLRAPVNSRVKELYRIDKDFRTIIDNQHPLPREVYCETARNSSTTDEIKNCVCGNEELLVYCQALAFQNYNEQEASSTFNSTEFSIRSKRAVIGCDLSHPLSGDNAWKKVKSFGGFCFGGECSIPLEVVSLNMESQFCIPVIDITDQSIRFCADMDNNCPEVSSTDELGLKILAERSAKAGMSMCVTELDIISKLLHLGADICWEMVAVEYKWFVGLMDYGSSLQLILVKLSGGAVVKVHDMIYPEMCDFGSIECEDYCILKDYDWHNGQAYGYIKLNILAIFGWSGIPLVDKKIDMPRKLGCQAGAEAAVVLRNDKTCKNVEDRKVWRRCWSKDDKDTEFELMTGNIKGFHFKPWARTLFTCEFIDKNLESGQKIGFDVYGGTSHNKGKKSFYYAVKNDGVYFGLEKFKEDTLVKAWADPCVGEEEDPPTDSPTDTSSTDLPPFNDSDWTASRSEPTGQSSGCGKRIVGYYTGWGDREITQNQLQKLTHVIFAFVAMYPDGTVRFGPVSADDSGPEAGAKAKRRFLDMKQKARSANSGVHIQFAVGGWDNSQYFSSMASGSRKVFIDSVVAFIEEHGIDGVDIDWEYPDIKGGDKNNQVALLRELRERFSSLQAEKGRKTPYVISLASAAGEWNLREGYDLNGVLQYADFINVMTYDYYGAWASKWGAYTGPPAPLFYGSLKGFSGKLNADFSMKFYTCKTKKPSQLNMGVPFYGRFWRNVEGPIDGKDGMWRTAQSVGGTFEGGYVGWRNLEREGWNKNSATWHDKTKTPYIFNSGARMFLGFENERSLQEKVSYATSRNLGGLMIWALDLDDDSDTLLNLVSSAGLCAGGSGDSVTYTCVPIDDVRWWTPENSDETRQGECGKSAPLINGYYPVCDPDDPGFSCCGAAGYCGSEKEYCDCPTCVDYRKDPMAIVKEPVKPTQEVQWYLMDAPDGKRGRCGKDAPLLNGKIAICNPDDDSKHCCSNGGYCGVGKEYCECDGCTDYRKKSS